MLFIIYLVLRGNCELSENHDPIFFFFFKRENPQISPAYHRQYDQIVYM